MEAAIAIFSVFLILTIVVTLRFRQAVYSYEIFISERAPSFDQLQFGSWPALQNADFFNIVKNSFLKEKASFIEADLSAMRLTLYLDGNVAKEVPILTKGKEGSWWETPAGIYKIEDKLKNHFSNFAGVYLPWSMPFQGNFFIHGWPYYPGGEPVASTYSGGCIRLATADAEELFKLVKVGMPVMVFERDFHSDSLLYKSKVNLSAKSYLAADLGNNFVFTEKFSDQIMPIASLTKLMTALVAVEYVNIEREIEITDSMIASTTIPRLKAGMRVSLFDLLHILLLESSNEAAEAISHYVGPTRFIELMNQKAKAIGMNSTHFVDPAGSQAGNVSTAQDLFNLAKYLYNNRSFILKITTGRLDTNVYEKPRFSKIKNFNLFGDREDFVGGKVGLSTAAGQTILSVFELEVGRAERQVAVILLDLENPLEEIPLLLGWIKSNYITE